MNTTIRGFNPKNIPGCSLHKGYPSGFFHLTVSRPFFDMWDVVWGWSGCKKARFCKRMVCEIDHKLRGLGSPSLRSLFFEHGLALRSTVIVGLGNDLLSDDGVGLYVARRLRRQLDPRFYEVLELSVGGIELVERLAGFRRAIIIDGCRTGRCVPGTVTQHRAEEFNRSLRLSSFHTMDFGTALELARRLGARLPDEIIVFAIEVEDVETLGECCTPHVEAAIEPAARAVREFVESR